MTFAQDEICNLFFYVFTVKRKGFTVCPHLYKIWIHQPKNYGVRELVRISYIVYFYVVYCHHRGPPNLSCTVSYPDLILVVSFVRLSSLYPFNVLKISIQTETINK